MKFTEEPESIRAYWDSVIPSMSMLKRGDLFDWSAAQNKGSTDI
jgi:hypothetical protein